MLQNRLELIVQYPVDHGYVCRGFRGLRLAAPVYVVFDGTVVGDQVVANLLGSAFCQEVLRFAGVGEETSMPCHGGLSSIDCHAMGEPSCQKILVRPAATGQTSPGTWLPPTAETVHGCKNWPGPTWQVIPAMPAGAPVAGKRPSPPGKASMSAFGAGIPSSVCGRSFSEPGSPLKKVGCLSATCAAIPVPLPISCSTLSQRRASTCFWIAAASPSASCFKSV